MRTKKLITQIFDGWQANGVENFKKLCKKWRDSLNEEEAVHGVSIAQIEVSYVSLSTFQITLGISVPTRKGSKKKKMNYLGLTFQWPTTRVIFDIEQFYQLRLFYLNQAKSSEHAVYFQEIPEPVQNFLVKMASAYTWLNLTWSGQV